MRHPWTQLYVHLVWSTWKRAPLITPDLQQRIYAVIQHQASQLGADVIAIGGIEDHVQMLVRFPTTIALATFVQRLKGASSHFVTHVARAPHAFKWQGGYGAITVSKRGVPFVRAYVLNQVEHHRTGTLYHDLERTEESSNVVEASPLNGAVCRSGVRLSAVVAAASVAPSPRLASIAPALHPFAPVGDRMRRV
jgi:putative transposase